MRESTLARTSPAVFAINIERTTITINNFREKKTINKVNNKINNRK